MRWPVYALAGFLFTLLAWVLAPILPLLASAEGWLPGWLRWFQTLDNSLDGDGNREAGTGWKGAHWLWRYELPEWLCTYVGRVGWLLRNPGYGFDFGVLGFDAGPGAAIYIKGNLTSDDTYDGWYLRRVINLDGSSAWQFWFLHHWTANHFMRVNLGWKLWSAPGLCQCVLAFNPWRAV